ncbi:type VI secretion system protein TssA [Marivibrio halodurans]|uniref:Type VI secretion system protein TssA n=1 Tax=Marivibrio halodurans TaxID=2039722 RepID=A0A8J7RZW4_9PROT|nr:type VI secretion system protein TssA [Marivibrio halodurans]MBP5857777.1 type VI secretion system protein TssA [Marivibrio halodurans]
MAEPEAEKDQSSDAAVTAARVNTPPRPVAEDGPAEALLAELTGKDGPCGPSLRYDPLFDRIRAARREEADLPQGVWERDIKHAEWATVRDLCTEALATRSKDLHLAFWLAEAWTHLEGFRGFRRGIDLAASLCEDYWEDLHPRIDEDGDLDFRLGPVQWANTQFGRLLQLVPITRPEGDERPYDLHDWHDVLRVENLRQRDKAAAEREARRKPSRGAFEASVSMTDVRFYADLVTVVEASLGEVARLDAVLDTKAGNEAPSLARMRDSLVEIDELARRYLSDKGGELPDPEDEAAEEPGYGSTHDPDAREAAVSAKELTMSENKPTSKMPGSGTPSGGVGGPIESRADAYRRLAEAADYLMRTEPHSPVPYLVRRAVVWGNMSFGELLVELMENGGDHQRVLRLLGLDEMGRPQGAREDG